ncbi:MAG: tetratricopeptide repeat protein [Alphaproteobacteria bacterium]|jgi:predicted O-linked N-acetylglucosamine transferase (SPINDLY family)|nr:tetratricopeptide repeat protein [Alphaproteobacteria bacterium]
MSDRHTLITAAKSALGAGNLAAAESALRRVLQTDPADGDGLMLLGIVAARAGKPEPAIMLFEQVIARYGEQPSILANLAAALHSAGRHADAIARARQALHLLPAMIEALNTLGNALADAGQAAEGAAVLARAVALRPDHPELWNSRGSALGIAGRIPAAVAALRHALTLQPGHGNALSSLGRYARQIADWRDDAEIDAALAAAIARGEAAIDPLVAVARRADPAEHAACAAAWAGARYPSAASRPAPVARDRLTIGYLSSDLHLHATALLAARVFELHDRGRFRIRAYSAGPDDGSAMRRRLVAAFDGFTEIGDRGDREAAEIIRADGVDILVDLKGHTRGSRFGILAHRPAPLQVAWLGFPGTCGAPYVDYVIGDPTVTPMAHQRWFAERIVQLPDSYQPNDDLRAIDSDLPGRAALGLPEQGVVFAAFNEAFKISPAMFTCWMRLLDRVPGSVLWLLDGPARRNLQAQADAQGIDPARLVFGGFLPPARHLARYARADLLLDTTPYAGHTTMSDALWAGCPAVTVEGAAFASRVAAGLLRAVGLPELIASDLEGYEALALALANDPERRAGLRRHLVEGGSRLPLFDSARFTRHLEAAYATMWQTLAAGKPPEGFAVAAG